MIAVYVNDRRFELMPYYDGGYTINGFEPVFTSVNDAVESIRFNFDYYAR